MTHAFPTRRSSDLVTILSSATTPREEAPIMAMTRKEMDRKLDEHFAFEAQDDVDGVLATLSPDVEHDIVGWPSRPPHGRAGARPFYETVFADLSEGISEERRVVKACGRQCGTRWWPCSYHTKLLQI